MFGHPLHSPRCTVVGARRSGIAAAHLAVECGYHVFLTDASPKEQLGDLSWLSHTEIEAEFGTHSLERALDTEMIITSPGVPPSAPLLHAALECGIPIVSELEFASWHAHAPIVAITGTNGKTTTTALTAHIFSHAGYDAIACGNIGLPLSDVVRSDRHNLPARRIYVVEASSYQLLWTDRFHPRVAVILNITPDHLSYHGSMEAYIRAKWKIFQNQTSDDVLILCADDPHAAEASRHARSHVRWFSLHPVVEGMYLRSSDQSIVEVSSTVEAKLMYRSELPVRGVHNVYNAMAAALAARAFEVTNENIRDSLLSFAGVEHRLEHVRTIGGVEYINDSKATNVNATWYALEAFEQPVVLLLGGQAENNDYSMLDAAVRKRCRAVIAFGEQAPVIFNHFCTLVRCYQVRTLEDAVACAHRIAERGDVVLLSPACKSFDEFVNYEHRGTVFKELVWQLPDVPQ